MKQIFPFNARTVSLAYQALREGKLVVLPTDTVYGVAASARSEDAIDRLYRAKGRSDDRPIPLLLSDPDRMAVVCTDIPVAAHCLAEHFWPGPLTIVLPKVPELPPNLTTLPTVGVRVPDHDLTRAVIRAMGGALAVTSANTSGGSNPLAVVDAFKQLGAAVTYYMDGGPAPGSLPSTVVGFDEQGALVVFRQGPIRESELRAVIGC
jgi:L-threonylcarbamoyladenylate synthase